MTEQLEAKIARLEVNSGDTVVVQYERQLHADQVRRISEYLRDTLPVNVSVLVLDSGATVTVLAANEAGGGQISG